MIPLSTRRLVLKRAAHECEDCGDNRRLELHHLHYRTVGHEEPDDLAALCRDCHHNRHIGLDGDFYADPEILEDTFFGYYHAMEKDD